MIKVFKFIFILLISVSSFAQSYADSVKAVYKQSLISNDIQLQQKTAQSVLKLYSFNTLIYYKTLLNSIQSKNILITNGYEDTYPITALQKAKGINSNVEVISLKLLNDNNYKTVIEKKLNIKLNDSPSNNLASIINNSSKKVYISSTVNYKYYQSISNQIYLIGLVLEAKCNNQLDQLNQFWKSIKQLKVEYLNLTTSEKQLFSNYLPPLLTLYKIYNLNQLNSNELKKYILKLAKHIDQDTKTKQILKQYE